MEIKIFDPDTLYSTSESCKRGGYKTTFHYKNIQTHPDIEIIRLGRCTRFTGDSLNKVLNDIAERSKDRPKPTVENRYVRARRLAEEGQAS